MTAEPAAASTRPAAARRTCSASTRPRAPRSPASSPPTARTSPRRGPWAVPTLVAEAGHAGEWESIPPARGYIGGVPIELGAARVAGAAHAADALRVGVRCDLAGPCVAGGQPWARFFSLAVELSDDNAPSVGLTRAGRPHPRGDRARGLRARRGRRRLRAGARPRRPPARDRPSLRHRALHDRRAAPRHEPRPVPARRARHRPARHPHPRRRRAHAGRAGRGRRRQRPHRRPPAIVVDNLPPRPGTVALAGDPVGGADRAAERLQRRGRRPTTTAGSAATTPAAPRSAAPSRGPTASARATRATASARSSSPPTAEAASASPPSTSEPIPAPAAPRARPSPAAT